MAKRPNANEKAAVIRAAQIIVQRQSGLLKDEEALAAPEAFEKWGPNMKYGENQIIQGYGEDTTLYRIVQPGGVEKSEAHRPPGSEGMLAIYRPIVKGHEGTLDDPIPYVAGMDCVAGKYYCHKKKVYLCKSDLIPCPENWQPGTPGMWQWEEVVA